MTAITSDQIADTALIKRLMVDVGPATVGANPTDSLAATPAQLVQMASKSDLGLGNVDNTSDANKPVSTATQTALDLKATVSSLSSHTGDVSNPHSVTKTQVGLGNVDNTSDANKPVSTATQTALDLKASASGLSTHIADTANPHSVTKTQVGLGNVDNTSDANKPVSTATQTALDLKVATSRSVATQYSLAGGGDLSANRTLNLVNDTASPGNNKVYGTDGSGVRGWKDDPAGGGTAISLNGHAWVEADGNNATAVLGDPAHPYLTMQAAFDAGATVFHLGVGTFSGFTTGYPLDFRVIGSGKTETVISNITYTGANSVGTSNIHDLGSHSCTITNVNISVAITYATTNPPVYLRGVCATNVYAYGATGQTAQDYNGETGPGQTGGTGSQVFLDYCDVGSVHAYGGSGGTAVDSNGGSGGASGVIEANHCTIDAALIPVAPGGTSTNASTGAAGGPGTINLYMCKLTGTSQLTGASGATAGTLTGYSSYVNILDINAYGSTQGTINGANLFIVNINDSATINAKVSCINNVAY